MPKSPKEGKVVKEVDLFALAEGDRIFIKDAYGLSILTMGSVTDDGLSRFARLVNTHGYKTAVKLPKRILVVGGSYSFQVECKGRFSNDGLSGFGYIQAIRIIRAKKAESPEPACPANP